MHVPHYLRELNPEQLSAALATEGPVLILAGAGSGKTRTLVYRIAHLIRGKQVPARNVLAVTFTNRAAMEMRERIGKVVGKESKGMIVSTFHSLGARILREHGDKVGLPKEFAIYPTGDQLASIKRVMTEEVNVAATAGDDKYDVKQVLFQISDWKNRMVGPEEAVREVAEGRMRYNRKDDYAVLAADVYPRYEQTLRAAGACDFDDLLLLPVRLLQSDVDIRRGYWKRWRYIMIDEYQDTNGAQFEMARLLTNSQQQNLCVVGDDDQSIYAWRGADVRNILDFERHFPGAKVVVMEENYRSTQRILDAANGVIANNTSRKEKRLRTSNGPGPKVDYWELNGGTGKPPEVEEAELVAREIGMRQLNEKLRWSDFAVLYRTNLQSRPLEEALRAVNIPYRVVGGTSYFDRKEVVDAVAYLRLVVNPKDEVALRRIVNYPTRGIGKTTLMKAVDAARAEKKTLYETLKAAHAVDGISKAQWEAIREFVEMMEEARMEYAATEAGIATGNPGERTLHTWARGLVKRLRLEEAVRKDNQSSERAAEVRVDILREFVDSIATYEDRVWNHAPLPDEEDDWAPPSLASFLERISLSEEGEEKKDDKDKGDANRATLMTLHSAKGLEFTHVFMVGLEEEILPHSRSVQMVSDPGVPDPIAEERRLFYVGITRARHRLSLTGCASRRKAGEDIVRQPSRFLKEIPPELVTMHSGAQSSLTAAERKVMGSSFFASMKELLAN
ncbi:MAG TPA: UvrD-helicase domain-containing protein [Longimicrobiaceae bacterium]|nr:UvrD-helicase domain-containing protein [Longimicrobiaceae bacterium]